MEIHFIDVKCLKEQLLEEWLNYLKNLMDLLCICNKLENTYQDYLILI